MKNFIVISSLILYSCSMTSSLKSTINIKKEDITIRCIVDSDKNLRLFIKNNLTGSIRLSSPECYANTRVLVKHKNQQLQPQFIIKINPECTQKYYEITSHEEKSFVYDFNLTELYDLVQGEEYKVCIIYYGSIKAGTKTIVNKEGIKSNTCNYRNP